MSADIPGPRQSRTAATKAFDIRTIIASLFLIYGVVLTVLGLFPSPEEIEQGGGNLNLWSGLGMLAFAVVMGGWVLLQPVKVPEERSADSES